MTSTAMVEGKAFTPTEDSIAMDMMQILIDASGQILSLNDVAKGYLPMASGGQDLLNLKDVLLWDHPDWHALLPEHWESLQQKSIFLPWDKQDQPGLGWKLSSFCVSTDPLRYLLTFVSGIAPDLVEAATEEGLSEKVEQTMHHLFFRTQQTEARLRQFLQLLPGVPYAQDRKLHFTYQNEQLRSLLGTGNYRRLSLDEHWREWIHVEDRENFERSLSACHSNRTPVSSQYRLQLPDDDRVLYVLDLRLPIRSVNGQITGYEGLWLDMTRQTLAEKRLQSAAWKTSLAEITGSLSYDFNNILTGVVNLSDLLCTAEECPASMANDLEIIRDSTRQAQQLIHRIVSLNREHCGEIKLHNLTDIVAQQKDLIRIVLPQSVQFSMQLPDMELPVKVDASAIRRILLNFATNARDALNYRGRVQVKLRQVDLAQYPKEHIFSHRCRQTGMAAELVFADNGSGIEPKILHRIFSPYFSTKHASRGSGLGLYSMTRFAQENGFDFGVRSVVGEGTDMILLIPLEDLDQLDFSENLQMAEATPPQHASSKKPQVAIYGRLDQGVVHLTREFIRNGIGVLNFEEDSLAIKWLKRDAQPGDVFVVLMDHRKQCSEHLLDKLRLNAAGLRRLLCVRGFNPDELKPQLRAIFDDVFEENPNAEESARFILSQTPRLRLTV